MVIEQHHLTYIRIMMLNIRESIDCKVEINESTVRSLYFNLIAGSYDTIVMYHGEEFTTAMMEIYAECELYEVCANIRDKMHNVNELIEIN